MPQAKNPLRQAAPASNSKGNRYNQARLPTANQTNSSLKKSAPRSASQVFSHPKPAKTTALSSTHATRVVVKQWLDVNQVEQAF
jgi:hypothetical protein